MRVPKVAAHFVHGLLEIERRIVRDGGYRPEMPACVFSQIIGEAAIKQAFKKVWSACELPSDARSHGEEVDQIAKNDGVCRQE